MSAEANKAISRDLLDGVWNKRDMRVADRLIHPNLAPKGPFSDQFPPGPEGTKAFVSTFLTAFPDVQCTIDKQETEGDLVKTWTTFVGNQTGLLMDIPPTGNQAITPVLFTDRIASGQIVESLAEWDPDEMMRQLGVSSSG